MIITKQKCFLLFSIFCFVILMFGCKSDIKEKTSNEMSDKKRDINLVTKDYTDTLMAIPGVVGVFSTENEDGVQSIHIMVIKRSKELEEKIPHQIEGYPIIIDETGEIKPLKGH